MVETKFVVASLLATISLYPSFVTCGVQWPDNSTQHKGYIEVCKLERVRRCRRGGAVGSDYRTSH